MPLNIFYVINSSDPAYNVHARPGFVLETVSINRAEGINVDMRDMWLRYMMQEHPIETVDILGVPTNCNCKFWHWLPL